MSNHVQLKKLQPEGFTDQGEGKRVNHDAPMVATDFGSAAIDGDPITIGEALEAVITSVGDKPVNQSDADAIGAAEIRATGEKNIRPEGIGATAQSAATLNSHVTRLKDMTKLSDVLTDATGKLPIDKAVTKEDAEAVYAAEVQSPRPGGVAKSMSTAATLNQQN
ncbi:hypothetical protein TanjilG_15657 [Lupinus angustifolius]|uniref:SMP domain-containing protein n=2 Tax=Lupinus angustifolius TaxID=3871 RepID=A0A1J7HW06_LUPAN|nr:hypothetical protein TanjilG_15657 [Lupinus angustifolius]